jgi:uncharacterized protein YgiB involved in biofilm formation
MEESKKASKRKSSARVSLVLIGAAALSSAMLTGCGKDDVRRDVYANKEDCLADWGNSPQDCEPAYDHPASRGPSTAYYGRPYSFRGGQSVSPSRSGKTIGSTSSVSRGGFGGSGMSSSG